MFTHFLYKCFVFKWSHTELRNPENGAFSIRGNSILTCSVGGGHSTFFDFDGDETFAHLSSLIFFGSKNK